jgi:hypothetical protein
MRWAELRMCRFWAGGISSFPFSRAREYRLLRRLHCDRKPGILAKIELRIHFNGNLKFRPYRFRLFQRPIPDSSLKRIIPEPHVPSRGSQARGTRLLRIWPYKEDFYMYWGILRSQGQAQKVRVIVCCSQKSLESRISEMPFDFHRLSGEILKKTAAIM